MVARLLLFDPNGMKVALHEWFHNQEEPYNEGTIFTRAELVEIMPLEIHDWMAIGCFGRADYDIDIDRPTGCRSSTLSYKMKSVSFFMPNQQPLMSIV